MAASSGPLSRRWIRIRLTEVEQNRRPFNERRIVDQAQHRLAPVCNVRFSKPRQAYKPRPTFDRVVVNDPTFESRRRVDAAGRSTPLFFRVVGQVNA